MTHNQWALFILLQELLDNPALAHKEVFRRLSQAGLQDLISPDRHGP
jgi:transposase, mutator family